MTYTVRAMTNDELVSRRGGGNYSEVFVIHRTPNTIYTAQLDGVPASHDMVAEIEVQNGSGTASNIKADMKVFVGTAAGGHDLGVCRLRKVPSLTGGAGTFEISELSHIDWQADCHLTVTDDYDIMPRHLKIISGESYIDYDIDFSDQHTDFDPVVNMGGNRVLIIEDLDGDSSVSHDRTCADSFVFDGTIASRLWSAPGSSNISAPTAEITTITYENEGDFVEYCSLTSNDGKTFVGVRFVFIRNRSSLSSLLASLEVDEGSDGIGISYATTQDISGLRPRNFVIVFTQDYCNGAKESIGYSPEEENILACGRIDDESIEILPDGSGAQITAYGWNHWLGETSAFPFGLERTMIETPDNWTSMPSLSVNRAVWELLHRYCTATRIADFHPSDNALYAAELSSTSDNLASQIEEIAMNSIFAKLVYDRFGSGWLRIEPQLVPEADRAGWAVIQTITGQDREGSLKIELNELEEVSQVASSGVYVSQFGSGQPRISLSYGRIYALTGNPESSTNLLLNTQSDSNSIAGLIMGWVNRFFDSLSFPLIGNNRMYSIAQYCRAYIEFDAATNVLGIEFAGYLCPRSIRYQWERESGEIITIVSFEDESEEQISVTGDFPDDTGIDNDFSLPPPPSIPIPPPLPFPIPPGMENPNLPKKVVISTATGVYFTETFDQDVVIWREMNAGLTDDQRVSIDQLTVTPSGRLYALSEWISGGQGYTSLLTCAGLGGEWQKILDASEVPADPAGSGGMWGIAADPLASDRIGVTGGRGWSWPVDGNIGSIYLGQGNHGGITWGSKLHDWAHAYQSALARCGDVWYIACAIGTFILGFDPTPGIIIATAGGAYVNYLLVAGNSASSKGIAAMGMQKKAMQWDNGGADFGYNTVVETATNIPSPPSPKVRQACAFSPDGTKAMTSSGGLAVPYRSVDGGDTWESLSGGGIPVGSTVFENCKDNNRWIFGSGMFIRLTMDHGLTYVERMGNLLHIDPLSNITGIRYIE